ncbi:MAG: histidine kinase [Bacteroidota bacterium]
MKKAKEILGFNDRWFMLIGIPMASLLINALIFTELLVEDPYSFFGKCLTTGLVYTVIYWIVLRQLLIFSRIKFPLTKNYGRRLVVQIIIVFIIYFILKALLDPILHPSVDGLISDTREHGLSMTIGGLTVTFLVLGVYETAMFYFQLQKSQLEKERLMKENMHSQLESLKNQVNPHFFFNSLNTLAYLIPEDPVKAENFVQKLSKAYRYILEIREQELMPLEDELNFLDSYTCLLKERFGDNIKINIEVPDGFLQQKIIPLSLQMLFENAIKHNIISSKYPLTIDVSAEKGDQLVVKNNLQRKNQVMNSTKVGLENIKRRYRLVCDQKVEVISSSEFFIVILPLIKKELAEVKPV